MASPGTRSTSPSWWDCCCGRAAIQRKRKPASRRRCARTDARLNRLPGLAPHAADDFQAAVGLLLQRIERLPGFAIVVDDMDALRDLAAARLRLAELKTLVAIDRRVGVLDHGHEDVGLRENLLDAGGGVGIGRRRIIAPKRLFLRADHALRVGDVVRREGGESE